MVALGDDFRIATLPDKKWLYEQNLTLLNIFFDWRDRLLRLGLGGASALIAVATFSHGRGGPANGIVPARLSPRLAALFRCRSSSSTGASRRS